MSDCSLRRCASPPCEREFVPRRGGSPQRYCSHRRRRARDRRYRSTEHGRQVQLAADRRYAVSAKGRARDERWYYAGGWSVQEHYKRQRRLAENLAKLEELGFDGTALSADAASAVTAGTQAGPAGAGLVFGGLRATH
jgi:hypothetical protein